MSPDEAMIHTIIWLAAGVLLAVNVWVGLIALAVSVVAYLAISRFFDQ